ncbi:DUF3562 domain-containing protein [Nitrosovibrio tenuis]|uniref:Uncharacterized protein n=1 Tax=Nitrosovibrio tenuis TaxID=1233 RepID=A0A1H7P8A2_9PROT|nr:DUF3562 domain-containing protein [Nitrosovibrio tenuis]SEL31317.1 Protein of unknown function [Nitrosovibrio tenuis]
MGTSNHAQLQPEDFAIIKGLAKEISWPVEEVEDIYAEILGRLSSSARIHDFLTVLTYKKVREVLRHARKSTVSRDSVRHRKSSPFILKADPGRQFVESAEDSRTAASPGTKA